MNKEIIAKILNRIVRTKGEQELRKIYALKFAEHFKLNDLDKEVFLLDCGVKKC